MCGCLAPARGLVVIKREEIVNSTSLVYGIHYVDIPLREAGPTFIRRMRFVHTCSCRWAPYLARYPGSEHSAGSQRGSFHPA
jgi:hypothetical protein